MANYVSEPEECDVHPAGPYRAVFAKAVDLGVQQTPFGQKPQEDLYFDTECQDSNGNYRRIRKRVTKSLARGATLREIVEALLNGKAITKRLDLDTLVDSDCVVIVSHNVDKAGRVWANVSRVLAPGAPVPAQPKPGPLFKHLSKPSTPQSFTLTPEVQ